MLDTAAGIQLGLPFHLPDAPEGTFQDGRARGADTEAILGELGLTATQIERLREVGAI